MSLKPDSPVVRSRWVIGAAGCVWGAVIAVLSGLAGLILVVGGHVVRGSIVAAVLLIMAVCLALISKAGRSGGGGDPEVSGDPGLIHARLSLGRT